MASTSDQYKGTMRRLVGALILGALIAPAGASARAFPDWEGYETPVRPFAAPVRDRVVDDARPRTVLRARTAASGYSRYQVAGSRVSLLVSVSDDYTGVTRADVQDYVDANFGWLTNPSSHGYEVSRVSVRVETPQGMQSRCGSTQALACYSPNLERMIVTGEETPEGQAPLPFVAAHEYGHHIAYNRVSPYPFYSGTVGPPHWATYERVCPLTLQGRLFPGDQDDHYEQNPGEGWAEAFAFRLFPNTVSWGYTPLLKPGVRAFGAVRHDVQAPWKGTARKTVSWRVGPGRPRTKRFRLTTLLDGEARIKLSGAPRARFVIRRYLSGRFIRRTRARYTKSFLCGNRRAEFRVTRVSGSGRVRATISRP